MYGPRRLPAVEHVDKPRERGGQPLRHRHPREHRQRYQPEHDQRVAELLQHVIAPCLVALGKAKQQMILGRTPDSPPVLAPRNHVVPQMPAEQRIQRIHERVDHEQPGEKEVPLAAHGQPLDARNRRPGGKCAGHPFAVDARGAEPAGGIELIAGDAGDPRELAVVRAHGVNVEKRIRWIPFAPPPVQR